MNSTTKADIDEQDILNDNSKSDVLPGSRGINTSFNVSKDNYTSSGSRDYSTSVSGRVETGRVETRQRVEIEPVASGHRLIHLRT